MKPFSQAGKGPNGHRATVIEHKKSAQLFTTLSQMRYRSMHPSGVCSDDTHVVNGCGRVT